MPVRVDFTNVPMPDQFEPLPEGRYLVRCTEVDENKTTKDQGYPMWACEHRVCTGPEGAPDARFAGRRLWDNVILGGDLRRAKMVLHRLGRVPLEKLDGEVTVSADLIRGKVVHVDVYSDEWPKGSGKLRDRIQFDGYQPASPEEIKYWEIGDGARDVTSGGEPDDADIPF